MSPLFQAILVASGVAAAVSVLELVFRREKGIYRSAIPFCVLYAIFDVAAALMVFSPLHVGADKIQGKPIMWAAVSAGLVAPLLMRVQVKVPFVKGKMNFYALGMLRRLHLRVSAMIDDRCAAGETAWILDEVLPSVRALPLLKVEEWVRESINVRFNGAQRRQCLDQLRKVCTDQVSEDERKRLLMQILIDRCGRLQVLFLVRRAKTWNRTHVSAVIVHSEQDIVIRPTGSIKSGHSSPGSNNELVSHNDQVPAERAGAQDPSAEDDDEDADEEWLSYPFSVCQRSAPLAVSIQASPSVL